MEYAAARRLIGRFRRKRVGVVGDLMLDRYLWGTATRISQEAPIPVVRVRDTTSRPGGAANVLLNVARLGAAGVAFGVAGRDAHGQELAALLKAEGIALDGYLREADRVTTTKARIVAGNQQVVRVDTERTEPLSAATARRLLRQLERALEAGALDAVIVEDYAKGTVTRELLERIVALCAPRCVPVALDPHPANPFNVPGITLMTPNRHEAFALAGVYEPEPVFPIGKDRALAEVARRLYDTWQVRHLLITLGAGGMALFEAGGAPHHIATRAREVFDVSGAGDTVIASFVLALLAGADPRAAADVANHAAGVVVGKMGTAPVLAAELAESFHPDYHT